MIGKLAACFCLLAAFSTRAEVVENDTVRLSVEPSSGLLTATDKRTGEVWSQYQAVREGYPAPSAAVLRSVDTERRTIELGVDLCGLSKDGKPGNAPFNLVVTLDATEPRFTLDFIPKVEGEWIEAAYPNAFVLSRPSGQLLLPHAEGLLAPLRRDSPDFLDIGKDYIYSGLGAYCACLGLVDTFRGDGLLYLFDDPELAGYEPATVEVDGSSMMTPRLIWRSSKYRFSQTQRVTVCLESEGGHVALAKRYKEFYVAQGHYKSLEQKAKENPTVDLLVGAPVFWIHRSPQDVLDVLKMMKEDGIERAVVQVGFTYYDLLPDGEKDAKALESVVKQIRDLGYVVSKYDQYRDCFERKPNASPYAQHNTEAFPDGCVRDESGNLRHGWPPGYVLNPAQGLQLAQVHIPDDLKRYAYNGRFIDCAGTCMFWEAEDWSASHEIDVYGARKAREDLLKYVNSLGLVVGTEGGIDCLLKYLHWLETPMSLVRWTAPGLSVPGWNPVQEFPEYSVSIGTTYRIPFFSLVHHSEVMITWRWEDGFSRLPNYWKDKELWSILYGNPPMFFVNRDAYAADRARIAETCNKVCRWTRKVGYAEMLSHRFITPDRRVQETSFSSGHRAVANFGDTAFTLPDGRSLAAHDYLTYEP